MHANPLHCIDNAHPNLDGRLLRPLKCFEQPQAILVYSVIIPQRVQLLKVVIDPSLNIIFILCPLINLCQLI